MGRFLRTWTREPSECLLERADPEGHGEAHRRDEAGELSSVMEGFRHHPVRQHRQDSPGRECEDDGNRPRRGRVERDVAEQRARPKPRATRTQKRVIRRGSRPARARADVAAIAAGRFATNTATRKRDADRAGLEDSQAEDEGLRNAVEDDSEDERAAGWRRPGLGRTTRCEAKAQALPRSSGLVPSAGQGYAAGPMDERRPQNVWHQGSRITEKILN